MAAAQLDLSSNGIRSEGVKPLAKALEVNASLTELNLDDNFLKDEGCTFICDALRESKTCKLTVLNLGDNRIKVDGGKSAAAYLAISTSLTQVFAFLAHAPPSHLSEIRVHARVHSSTSKATTWTRMPSELSMRPTQSAPFRRALNSECRAGSQARLEL